MNLKSGWLFLVVLSLLAGVVGGCGLDGEKGGESALALIEAQPLYLPLEVAARKVEPDETGSIRLAVGEPLEARLTGGEVHRFALPEHAAGKEHFVVALLDQRGIDLVLKLVNESDQVVSEADSYNVDQGIELLESQVPRDPPSFLVVQSLEPTARTGSYRIELLQWLQPTVRQRRIASALPKIWNEIDLCYQTGRKESAGAAEKARRHCEAAVRLSEELDYDHGAGWAYYLLGEQAHGRGKLAVSVDHFAKARQRWHAPRYTVERAMISNQEAMVARQGDDSATALDLFVNVVEYWRQRGAGSQLALSLNGLGLTLNDRGKYGAAIELFVEAEELYRQLGLTVDGVDAIFNRGVAEYELGNLLVSRALYEEAELRLKGHETKSRETFSYILIALTLSYRHRGELWRMSAASERALTVLESVYDPGNIDDLRTMGSLVQNRASSLLALGDKRAALGDYRRALEFFRQAGDRGLVAYTLGNLGNLRARQGEEEKALDLFAQALEIAREIEDKNAIPLALRWRGALRLQQGELDLALEDLDEALRAYRASGAKLAQIGVLNSMAELHLDAGRFQESTALLEEALELNGGLEPNLEATSRYVWSRLLREQGELETALTQMERVLEIDRHLRAGLAATEARDAFLEDRRDRFEMMVDLLVRLAAQAPQSDYVERAFLVSERARARGLSELLAEADVEFRSKVSPTLLEREKFLDREIISAGADLRELRSSPDSRDEELAALQLRIDSLRTQRRRLEVQIRLASPLYAELTYPKPATVQQTQELLAPGTVVLEYVVSDYGCHLFVIGRDQFEVIELPISVSAIRRTVDELRRGLAGTGQFQTNAYRWAARSLYEALVAPAKELLGEARRLVVIPDRELYYVPFEALLTEEVPSSAREMVDWPYLMRQYEVVYSPSASVLTTLHQERVATTDRIVIFADPAYRGRLPRLTASGREAKEIGELFPDPRDVTLYLREEASEFRVKNSSELPRARWVHFATHASIDEQETVGTRLELAGGSSEDGEDGALHLSEIFDLDLSAQLVVLSACQTALGREVTGEGLVGLSRGFFYAGARSLVTSQWRVEDEQTAEVMVRFYRALLASEDPIVALRQAKLETLEARGVSAHPHYWAPFVLVGNPARARL